MVTRDIALGRQLLIHLGSKAVHQHQFQPHRVQYREVLHDVVELAGGNAFAGQRNHEGLAPVSVDVGRNRAKPGHEGVGEYEAHGAQKWWPLIVQQRSSRSPR